MTMLCLSYFLYLPSRISSYQPQPHSQHSASPRSHSVSHTVERAARGHSSTTRTPLAPLGTQRHTPRASTCKDLLSDCSPSHYFVALTNFFYYYFFWGGVSLLHICASLPMSFFSFFQCAVTILNYQRLGVLEILPF